MPSCATGCWCATSRRERTPPPTRRSSWCPNTSSSGSPFAAVPQHTRNRTGTYLDTRRVCDGGNVGCNSRRRVPKQYVDIARAPDEEVRPDGPVPTGCGQDGRLLRCPACHIDIWPAPCALHTVRPDRNASRAGRSDRTRPRSTRPPRRACARHPSYLQEGNFKVVSFTNDFLGAGVLCSCASVCFRGQCLRSHVLCDLYG